MGRVPYGELPLYLSFPWLWEVWWVLLPEPKFIVPGDSCLQSKREVCAHAQGGVGGIYSTFSVCIYRINATEGKRNTMWYLCSHSLLCVIKDTNLFHSFLKSSDNYVWYDYIVSGLVYCLKVVDRTPCIRNWGCLCSQMKDREAPIHLYLITYLLTMPWSRVFLDKLTSFQLVKKFSTFYGTQGLLPHSQMPTTYPYPEPAQSSLYSHFLNIHLNITTHLCLGLPSGLFP
jgi:hypothetical protein